MWIPHINNELLIDNSSRKFKTTVWGITYTDDNDNTTSVFKNTDVRWNLLGQLVVDSEKYYYDSIDKSIRVKGSQMLVIDNIDGVSYHEYVEILNSNYYCVYDVYKYDSNIVSVLCHKLHPISTYGNDIVYNDTGYIQI